MNRITLRTIEPNNIEQCLSLKVSKEQERFVATTEKSLAYAYAYREQSQPLGIYVDEEMIGYVLTLFDREDDMYCIWHMMMDSKHQGYGYGGVALKLVIAYFQTVPFGKAKLIGLTCHEENEAGLKLYHQAGFKETGEKDEDDELIMVRSLV